MHNPRSVSRLSLALFLLALCAGTALAQVYQVGGKTGYFSAGTNVSIGGGHLGTKADPHPINAASFASLVVADIDDPSAELNARTGDTANTVLLVYEVDALGTINGFTFYGVDETNLTEFIPQVVDSGDGKSYTAICGRYGITPEFWLTLKVNLDNTKFIELDTSTDPVVRVTDGSAISVLGGDRLTFGDTISGFQVDLLYTALTADRAITLPDADGTVLLDSTPYANFPAFSGPALLLGSDDGGTTAEIDLGSTLSIVGTTLRVAADSIGPTQINETSNYTWTGTHSFTGGTITVPTATAGDNDTSAASTAFVTAAVPNASYRTLFEAAGSHIAGKVAGTYGFGDGDPLAVSGTGTLYPLKLFRYEAADYPRVNGATTKLRTRAVLAVNDTALFTGTFKVGLYPVTRPGTSGGAGLNIYTIGTLVSGSEVTFTNPAADLLAEADSGDFTPPSDGYYVFAVVTSATVATNSLAHCTAYLQQRNA